MKRNNEMKYRMLGLTELNVSEVAFGVWSVSTGWWGKVEKDDAIKLLRTAVDQGITLFDTADTYAQGYGEEILRDALRKQRHELFISTKFGYDLDAPRSGEQRERPQRWEPEFIRAACEASLRRLGTDYM